MKDILQDIIANKRIEVDRQKQAVQLRTLLALGGERLERTTYSMRASLAASSSGIIAEFKRKSPSKGWLHPDAAIPDIIPAYQQAGASACSVLTDPQFFGGSLGDLCQARKLAEIPLLRKDFIIDEYQVYQAIPSNWKHCWKSTANRNWGISTRISTCSVLTTATSGHSIPMWKIRSVWQKSCRKSAKKRTSLPSWFRKAEYQTQPQ